MHRRDDHRSQCTALKTDTTDKDIQDLVDDVRQRVHDDFGGIPVRNVQWIVRVFENDKNAKYVSWWRSERCAYSIDHIVDPMLEVGGDGPAYL